MIIENKLIAKIIAFLLACLLVVLLFIAFILVKASNHLVNQSTLLQIENSNLIKQVLAYQAKSERDITTNALNEYTIKMIDEISCKILNREAIPESYFYFLKNDKELLSNINIYNETTALLVEYFAQEALDIVCLICGLTDEKGNNIYQTPVDYTSLPVEIHNLVDKITRYALQENSTHLIMSDPGLEQIRIGEVGGAYGMWPKWLHGRLDGSEEMKDKYLKYQELSKEIMGQIGDYISQQCL